MSRVTAHVNFRNAHVALGMLTATHEVDCDVSGNLLRICLNLKEENFESWPKDDIISLSTLIGIFCFIRCTMISEEITAL